MYRVITLNVDKFGIINATCVRLCENKEDALKLKAEYRARKPIDNIYVKRECIVQKYDEKLWADLMAKIDASNEKGIAKRDAHAKANVAKFYAVNKKEHDLRCAELAHAKNVAFHDYNNNRRG